MWIKQLKLLLILFEIKASYSILQDVWHRFVMIKLVEVSSYHALQSEIFKYNLSLDWAEDPFQQLVNMYDFN